MTTQELRLVQVETLIKQFVPKIVTETPEAKQAIREAAESIDKIYIA